MPKIINEFAAGNPLVDALTGFANSFGGNTAQTELYRQKATGLLRDNKAYQTLQDIERAGGYDPNNPEGRAAIVGLDKPQEYSQAQRFIASTRYGAADPRATNAYLGAGGSYGSTVAGTNAEMANRRGIAQMQTDRMVAADMRKYDMNTIDMLRPDGTVEPVPRSALAAAVERGYRRPISAADIKGGLLAREYGGLPRDNQMAAIGANVDYRATEQGARELEDMRTRRALETAQMTTDRTLAQQQRQFDNTFETVMDPATKQPTLVPRSQAVGRQPFLPLSQVQGGILQQDTPTLSPTQRAAAGGYAPKLPGNVWVYRKPDGSTANTLDGVTDAQTGQPITGPAMKMEGPNVSGLNPTVTSRLQQDNIAYQKFSNLLNMTREVAQRDPVNFGAAGFVKGILQDTGQLGQNLAVGLGYNGLNEALAGAQQSAAKSGINPALLTGLFDPSLSELHTLSDLMVFSAAEALAGQKGRDVSDKDVQMFKGIAGDPREWMMSQNKYMAKLAQIERIVRSYSQVNQQNMPSTRGGPPQSGAPAAPPAAVEQWERDPATGALRRVQ